MSRRFLSVAVASALGCAAQSSAAASAAAVARAKEILAHSVSIYTARNLGNVPRLAAYLQDTLVQGGFDAKDIEIIPIGETAGMIVRYRGDGSPGRKAIGVAAHMDVVEADPKDWARDPFRMIEEDGYLFGRGVLDCKFGLSMVVATFLKLKSEGFVPTRDIVLILTGDEESGMKTTRALAYDYRDRIDVEYILNSDAGGGVLAPDGTPVVYAIQAAEKTFASWDMTVSNPGGHSSRPRKDNAIYELADALKKIEAHAFPARSSDITRTYFARLGPIVAAGKDEGSKALGAAMSAFARDPADPRALAVLRADPEYVGTTGTTCIATMLKAGHAENALPQSATATVNCRIFPGEGVENTLATLKAVVGNARITWTPLADNYADSAASPLREDVLQAVEAAVHASFPGLVVLPQMESGGTDGKYFRATGWPTYGVDGAYMKPGDMFAHGLNERVPVSAVPLALDHWHHLLTDLAGR